MKKEERPNISKVTVQRKDTQQQPESSDQQVMQPDHFQALKCLTITFC